MDDITQKFLDRLKDLVALGKKKKSILDVQEINDFFNDMELNADQMEKMTSEGSHGQTLWPQRRSQ